MPFYYRKSVKLGKGTRLNLGAKSASISFGGSGASFRMRLFKSNHGILFWLFFGWWVYIIYFVIIMMTWIIRFYIFLFKMLFKLGKFCVLQGIKLAKIGISKFKDWQLKKVEEKNNAQD